MTHSLSYARLARHTKLVIRVSLLSILIVLGSALWRVQTQVISLSPKDRSVLLISLDGFPGRALLEPTLPTPTLKRLAAAGVVATGMKVSNPSVTWPNHTTLVTGVRPARHGVLFNGFLTRLGPGLPLRIDPSRDKRELVRVPTVYDLTHRSGLKTAQADWVAIQNADTISWAFPERPSAGGAFEQELIGDGVLTKEILDGFSKGLTSWRDQYWTDAAIHMIKKHRPNLLLLHLLNLDSISHRYGPNTPASYTAMAQVDAQVQRIIDALAEAGLKDRSTLLIVSDHGFKSVTRTIRLNAALREAGLLKAEQKQITCEAYVVPEGGTAMAYVTAVGEKAGLIGRLKEIFSRVEGVDRILEPSDYTALGLPLPDRNDQMGDLLLVAKTGYAFSGGHEGDVVSDTQPGSLGAHGYVSSDPDMNALFLAYGYGISKQMRLEEIDNLDIAPTLAVLLGLKMENVEGKPLESILTPAVLSAR